MGLPSSLLSGGGVHGSGPLSVAGFVTGAVSGLAQIAFAEIFEIVLCIQLLAGGLDQQVVEGQQRTLAVHVFAQPVVEDVHGLGEMPVREFPFHSGRSRQAAAANCVSTIRLIR
jgi:hypothetical protein